MRDDDEPAAPTDVLLVGAPIEDGGWPVLRHREDRLEIGQLRTMREGQPMLPEGEVVRLSPRPEHARLFDVEVLARLDEEPRPAGRSGPPQVATAAYRLGWDTTFDKKSSN